MATTRTRRQSHRLSRRCLTSQGVVSCPPPPPVRTLCTDCHSLVDGGCAQHPALLPLSPGELVRTWRNHQGNCGQPGRRGNGIEDSIPFLYPVPLSRSSVPCLYPVPRSVTPYVPLFHSGDDKRSTPSMPSASASSRTAQGTPANNLCVAHDDSASPASLSASLLRLWWAVRQVDATFPCGGWTTGASLVPGLWALPHPMHGTCQCSMLHMWQLGSQSNLTYLHPPTPRLHYSPQLDGAMGIG